MPEDARLGKTWTGTKECLVIPTYYYVRVSKPACRMRDEHHDSKFPMSEDEACPFFNLIGHSSKTFKGSLT